MSLIEDISSIEDSIPVDTIVCVFDAMISVSVRFLLKGFRCDCF